MYINHAVKETARTMGPSEVVYKCVRCSSVYATIKYIIEYMFVISNIAYQHDNEFVSKCD